MKPGEKRPAIIVGHPMGAVKEQAANLYAIKMAERGFVTLAIDLSFWGDSEGEPRNTVSPEIYAEDFSAAADFLGTREFVERSGIGAIGICGSGSFAVSAAKIDPRLKAVATVSMYDMGAASRSGLKNALTLEQRKRILAEIQDLGLNSIGIVAIISVFMGAVITIQMALNLESPFIPKYLIGYAARESMLLEFSSTVVALILAGKVGSNIASEIGTMRITEQIDALEIMGVNSASYLILPKIIGTVFFFPFLTILSMIIGVAGGYVVSILTGAVNPDSYIVGVQYQFKPFYITYSLIKSSVFAFIITSISGFYGYFANGNSLEVGRASTQAVVVSSIVILIFNLILTQLLLT